MTEEQKLVAKFYETIGKNIKGNLTDIIQGPCVYNFLIQPDVEAKQQDFRKLALKDTMFLFNQKNINVQIPVKQRKKILFNTLIKTKEYKNSNSYLPIILGVNTFGNPVIEDLYKMPHLLITGKTGTGKSVLMNTFLKSITKKMPLSECKVVIFDPKDVDFVHWNEDKHLLCPVINDLNHGLKMFDTIMKIIEDRYHILAENIQKYKQKNNNKDMPYIIVLIDELADYITMSKRKTETFLKTVTSKARSVGIHLIVSTQNMNMISKTVIANFPSRIVFQLSSSNDSITILGEKGADKLLAYNDALFSTAGCVPVRIHTAI